MPTRRARPAAVLPPGFAGFCFPLAVIVLAVRWSLLHPYIDPDSPEYPGHIRLVPTAANRQPSAATYLRHPGDAEHRLIGLSVLDVEDGLVVGIVSFGVDLLGSFGLPPTP